jgi:DNA repair protein REV1
MALLSNPWNRDNSTTNPDFIKKYYKSSRLHHLSTWKAELKDIVRKAKEQQASSISTAATLKKGNTRRLVMHVDFDCFFASVGIKSRPELSNSPVNTWLKLLNVAHIIPSSIGSCVSRKRSPEKLI